jgi:hypothetical protein
MSLLLKVHIRYQPGPRIGQVLYGDKRELQEALREDMLALDVPLTPLLRGTRDRDARAVIKPEKVYLAFERESFAGSVRIASACLFLWHEDRVDKSYFLEGFA